jgi:pimeloyl-ACP methyl ester carboxylesterase
MDYLEKKCRLLVPDLPGSGRSPYNPALASVEDFAGCIHAMIQHEKIEKFILLGHSMGGYISLAYAELYPAFLNAFGLFHSTAYADSPEKIALRTKGIEFIGQHGSAPFIRQSVPGLFGESFREKNQQVVESVTSQYSTFDPRALIAYYKAMIARPDRTRVLREFPRPVLFIVGEKDNAVPMQQALEQVHMPSTASIHILPGAGHMGMLEDPEASNAILEGFLEFVSIMTSS